jgi:hypothetical protein
MIYFKFKYLKKDTATLGANQFKKLHFPITRDIRDHAIIPAALNLPKHNFVLSCPNKSSLLNFNN